MPWRGPWRGISRHFSGLAGSNHANAGGTIRATEKGYRPYFLGARPAVLETFIAHVEHDFPAIELAGFHHGYFGSDEEDTVVTTLRRSRADCLFIGLPTPQKERFLARYRGELDIPFIMGVGGALDVLAGQVRRAPRFIQQLGLEWLFRTVQEPFRLAPRYLTTNAAFAGIMAKALAGEIAARANRAIHS